MSIEQVSHLSTTFTGFSTDFSTPISGIFNTNQSRNYLRVAVWLSAYPSSLLLLLLIYIYSFTLYSKAMIVENINLISGIHL